jgi:microcompartment protein CcmL/EutN
MKNTTKITTEELATKLNGKVWTKNEMTRIYLERGFNTKKVSTKTYVDIKGDELIVKCFIECPSQDYNWIQSQAKQVIEQVESEIEEILNPTEEEIEEEVISVPMHVTVKQVETKDESTTFEKEYYQGQTVMHAQFGQGSINKEEKDAVEVYFEKTVGLKRFLKKFVKLEKDFYFKRVEGVEK